MLFLTRGGSGWRKAATAATATALAATTLAFASSPAQADAENPVLAWNISQQYIDHFSVQSSPMAPVPTLTATDGATFAGGNITWTFDGATVDGSETTVQYNGTVAGKFGTFYGVTVEDPALVFDAATGAGSLVATVSGGEIGSETTPAEVTVAEFTGATVTPTTIAGTPNWDGVLPTGSAESLALNIPANQPVSGRSFDPAFLGNLTSGVRAHFYASLNAQGNEPASNVKKAPAAFTADYEVAPAPAPSVSANAAVNGDFVDVTVSGENVVPDASAQFVVNGVYVAFSEKRDIFDIDAEGAEDGAELFLATNHVSGAQLPGGVLSTVVAVDKTKLVRGKTYAIYTWTAHGNPKATDKAYTETVVDIPEAAFPPVIPPVVKKASATKVKVNKVPTTKKVGKATITVTGKNGTATGKVTFVLKKGKATKKIKAATLKNGKVAVKLPKLKKGKWKLTAKYAGSSKYKASSKTVTVKVKK